MVPDSQPPDVRFRRQNHWLVGLMTDIDDRKRAEEALRESEYEARLIVDSIPGMVGLTSPNGNLEMVSQPGLGILR